MIKLIVLDVDGCLSDGKLIYSADSIESKNFSVKDGLGITTWIKMGNKVAIITGRKSSVVKKRADELGIEYLFQGIKNKGETLRKLVESLGLNFYEVGAIGDDLNDYEMLRLVGRSFTPSDGVQDIRSVVDTVLTRNGGDGVVREMIDILVCENDQKDDFLSIWIKE
jgi:3-deoxy-D-manno-octulosonate 8-phosphate phosphatase (KDO 8-P phosphatase)